MFWSYEAFVHSAARASFRNQIAVANSEWSSEVQNIKFALATP